MYEYYIIASMCCLVVVWVVSCCLFKLSIFDPHLGQEWRCSRECGSAQNIINRGELRYISSCDDP